MLPSPHWNAPDPSSRPPAVHLSPRPETLAYAHEIVESPASDRPANTPTSPRWPLSEWRHHRRWPRQYAKTNRAVRSFCPANSWRSFPVRCRPATRPVWKNFNYLVILNALIDFPKIENLAQTQVKPRQLMASASMSPSSDGPEFSAGK